jgi:hypothetical protein
MTTCCGVPSALSGLCRPIMLSQSTKFSSCMTGDEPLHKHNRKNQKPFHDKLFYSLNLFDFNYRSNGSILYIGKYNETTSKMCINIFIFYFLFQLKLKRIERTCTWRTQDLPIEKKKRKKKKKKISQLDKNIIIK